MVTGTEVLGAAQGLKLAFDMLQGLNATAKAAAINEVKVALTQHIIEAQQALTAAGIAQANAAETIRDLEKRIVQFENWDAERERYELADAGQRSFAYRLKPEMENGQPAHWICPHCYERREKSIMRHEKTSEGRCEFLACHPCGLELVVFGVRPSASQKRAGTWGRTR